MFGISTFFKGKMAANFAPALRNIWLQRTCSIKVTPQFVSCDQITHRSKTVLFRHVRNSSSRERPRKDQYTKRSWPCVPWLHCCLCADSEAKLAKLRFTGLPIAALAAALAELRTTDPGSREPVSSTVGLGLGCGCLRCRVLVTVSRAD